MRWPAVAAVWALLAVMGDGDDDWCPPAIAARNADGTWPRSLEYDKEMHGVFHISNDAQAGN